MLGGNFPAAAGTRARRAVRGGRVPHHFRRGIRLSRPALQGTVASPLYDLGDRANSETTVLA